MRGVRGKTISWERETIPRSSRLPPGSHPTPSTKDLSYRFAATDDLQLLLLLRMLLLLLLLLLQRLIQKQTQTADGLSSANSHSIAS